MVLTDYSYKPRENLFFVEHFTFVVHLYQRKLVTKEL